MRLNDIKSVTVVHMEVPCCFGTARIVEEALTRSGKKLGVRDITISIRGDVKKEGTTAGQRDHGGNANG
jgi:hypothetical protein